jgi:hypothetical protein
MNKAFETRKTNGFVMNFPNGNSASIIWSGGSYTDNFDKPCDEGMSLVKYLSSDTVEIQVNCSEKLYKKILRKINRNYADYSSGYVIGYVNLSNLMIILNLLEKEVKNG